MNGNLIRTRLFDINLRTRVVLIESLIGEIRKRIYLIPVNDHIRSIEN